MGSIMAGWRFIAIFLAISLFFIPSLPTTIPGSAEGVIDPDIEVVSFEVPEKVRIHTRFEVRATVRNNGAASVNELLVEFKNGQWVCNHSIVHELGAGNSTEVSVEMWTGLTIGKMEDYSVVAAGKSLTVARPVLPSRDVWIDFKDIGIRSTFRRSDGVNLEQGISFNITLKNSGALAGAVTVVITGPEGAGEISRDEVIVNGTSERHLSVDWIYRGRVPDYPRDIFFRVFIEGNSTGEWNRSSVDFRIVGGGSTTGTTFAQGLVLLFDWIVVAIGVALFIAWRQQKREKARPVSIPIIKKIGGN